MLITFRWTAVLLTCGASSAALAQASWLPQRAMSAAHAFEVHALDERGSFTVHAFRVIARKSGQPVQDFAVENVQREGPADALLQLIDANRDGHLDVAMQVATGRSSAMRMSDFYLFDPATNTFASHPGYRRW